MREEVAQDMLLEVLSILRNPEKFIKHYWSLNKRWQDVSIEDSIEAQLKVG
jgi:hypothetical protein